MIELQHFEINLLGVLITVILLLLLLVKKINLISILGFSSVLINIPIFNYKPWTFGFQIFFFFSIILILSSIKKILINLKNKKFLILLFLVFLFVTIALISIINSYFSNIKEAVIRPIENSRTGGILMVSQFSSSNITQFLYLVFYFAIFISVIVNQINLNNFIKSFLVGINFNFIFQILETILLYLKKPLPQFLDNQSFMNETIQILYLKDFNIYRFSGLFPTPSLLGIYLTIAFYLLLFWKEVFNSKIFITQILIIILSFLLSPSSTFILGTFLILIFYFLFKNKKLYIPLILIILFLIFCYSILRESLETRTFSAFMSLIIFKKYPLLGIGWGSHYADLFTSLLANSGILGFFSFLSIFLWLIYLTLKIRPNIYLFLISLISLFLMGAIWHGINVNIVWLILGLWGRELINQKL